MARDPRSLDERRKDILRAAEELIIRKGYKETSLDAIVEKACCSKTMIYAYFRDKKGLLDALSEEFMGELSAAFSASIREHPAIDDVLFALARRSLELILSARHIAVLQVIVSEFRDDPGVGQAYFDLGPRSAQRELSEYLRDPVSRGVLRIADRDYAARQFFALVLWDHLHARMVGARAELTAKQMDTEARLAVASFLQLYPPRVIEMPAKEQRAQTGTMAQ
jgi:AcrR family transcriptional regulator